MNKEPKKSDPNPFILGVIPARWGSTRFEGKPLAQIAGKPMIQHVWERAHQCDELHALVIATDDMRIVHAAEQFNAHAILTSTTHESGTDRVAECLRHFPQSTHVINIQGDEPLIDPKLISSLAEKLVKENATIVTAACPIESSNTKMLLDTNIVKVTLSCNNRALYFSRSLIPHSRSASGRADYFRHIGIYGYQCAALKHFVTLPPSKLELVECLEQLRALQNEIPISVLITDHCSPGIDTPEQAKSVENLIINPIA